MPASDLPSQWAERRPEEDFYRLLSPEGRLVGARPEVSDEELLRWHRVIVETRVFEELGMRMQRRGELSVAGTSRGEEAVGVAAAATLQAGDWCFPSYRQTSALLYWNVPTDRLVAAMMGAPPEHVADHLPLQGDPPPVNILPYTIFLGASIPHAVGCALADRLHERNIVTLAFIGEGSTSEGDFYEALNLAGVFDVPLVTIIQNNQWSISVPAHRQTASRTFADKAVSVGLAHARVDGNDVLAVYEKTQEAVNRARACGGPTLIEAVTYRMGDHNSADSAALYRTPQESTHWQTLDPLDRLERYLEHLNLLSGSDKQRIKNEASIALKEAIARGRKLPPPPAPLMFANHLVDKTGSIFERQRRQLDMELMGKNPFMLDGTDDE